MAFIDNIRTELQLDATDISDVDLTYVVNKLGENTNLVCAHTLKLLIAKNKGRTRLKLSKFEEDIDVKLLYRLRRGYLASAGVSGYGEIEDEDAIFAMDGI